MFDLFPHHLKYIFWAKDFWGTHESALIIRNQLLNLKILFYKNRTIYLRIVTEFRQAFACALFKPFYNIDILENLQL